MITRRLLMGGAAAMVALPAAAHHGGVFLNDGVVIRLEGFVSKPMTGYPHWEIELRAMPERVNWTVDMTNLFRVRKAGFDDEASELYAGREIVLEGWPALNPEEKLIRALRIWIGDRLYDLYPEIG